MVEDALELKLNTIITMCCLKNVSKEDQFETKVLHIHNQWMDIVYSSIVPSTTLVVEGINIQVKQEARGSKSNDILDTKYIQDYYPHMII